MTDQELYDILKVLIGVVSSLVTIILMFIKSLHTKGMGELRQIKNAIVDGQVAMALHNEKLEQGTREFARIEEHQKSQDNQIHNLRNSVHEIRNTMMTSEHVELLIEVSRNNGV